MPQAPSPGSVVGRAVGAFYGWYVVAALFFSLFLGMGVFLGFGVFVETWEEEFNVSVGTISIAAAIGVLVNGVSAPLVGRLFDRFGGRYVVLFSLTGVGLGCLAMSQANSLVGVVVIYGIIISLAAAGVSPQASGTIVARWFHRRRGIAISVFSVGASFGGLLMIPFLTYLRIATDWQTAWLVIGLIILATGVPLVWLIVRNQPSDLNLSPDGDPTPIGSGAAMTVTVAPLEAEAWRDSLHHAPMWQLLLTFVVCGVTTASIAVHFIRFASDEGVSAGTAALAFGALSAINAIGVLIVGYLSDRLQRKNLLAGVYVVRGTAFICLIILPGSTGIWVFALLGGASWLPTAPLTQALTADVFGLRHLGILNGLIFMSHQLGGALAVYLFGVAFDTWGSYDVAFAVCVVLLAAAALGSFSIQEKQYSVRYAAQPAPAPVSGSAGGD
jgi:MFS family permease